MYNPCAFLLCTHIKNIYLVRIVLPFKILISLYEKLLDNIIPKNNMTSYSNIHDQINLMPFRKLILHCYLRCLKRLKRPSIFVKKILNICYCLDKKETFNNHLPPSSWWSKHLIQANIFGVPFWTFVEPYRCKFPKYFQLRYY